MTAQSAYQTYVEATINVSDPVELTRMLYRGAIESILKARRALAAKDVRARNSQISRAQAIIAELVSSLDPERAPDLALRLAQLYDYILFSLQTGNFEQRDAPMTEAQNLLEMLLEGWNSCDGAQSTALPGVHPA